MSKKAAWPRWPWYAWVLLFWFTSVLFGFVARDVGVAVAGHGQPARLFVIEWTIYLLMLLPLGAFLSRSPWVRHISHRRSICLLMIGAGLISSQVVNARVTYPFMAWGMYAQPNPTHSFHAYSAKLKSGAKVRLTFREIVPTTSPGSVRERLDEPLRKSTGVPDDVIANLRQLALCYNRLHPDDPLQSITIMRRTLRIEESGHSVDDHFIFELHVQDGGNHAPQP